MPPQAVLARAGFPRMRCVCAYSTSLMQPTMARTLDDNFPRDSLVEVAHDFYARGWMLGTAGNLSAREDGDHFWITASGKPKGRLDEHDFVLVRVSDGKVVHHLCADSRPSAETEIHRVLYQLFPEARACLHGHGVEACLAAAQAERHATGLSLAPIEMIKGFGIWEQNPDVVLPLFDNSLDVYRIAMSIHERFSQQHPALTALMVRSHGPTVWGASIQQAYDRFELLDFILRYQGAARLRGAGLGSGAHL